MLGILLTATVVNGDLDKGAAELATLQLPYIDVLGNTFVHFGELGKNDILEIWRIPESLSFNQPGTQIAKGFKDPHIVGSVSNGQVLLVRASRDEVPAQLYGFNPVTGAQLFQVDGLDDLVILDAKTSIQNDVVGLIAKDSDGQTDVWAISLKGWTPGHAPDLVRLTNTVDNERDILVSRSGSRMAWSAGTRPSSLFLAQIRSGSVRKVLGSNNVLYARDFLYSRTGDVAGELLLWEDHTLYEPGQMKSVVGWLSPDDLSTTKLITYESAGRKPLRPRINANGSRLSVSIPGYPRFHPQEHEDAIYPEIFELSSDQVPALVGYPEKRSYYDTKFGVSLADQAGDTQGSHHVVPFSNPIYMFPATPVGASSNAGLIEPDLTEVTWHPSSPLVLARVNGHYQDLLNSKIRDYRHNGWVHVYSLTPNSLARGSFDLWIQLTKLRQSRLPYLRGVSP